jgi:hypothetical protein
LSGIGIVNVNVNGGLRLGVVALVLLAVACSRTTMPGASDPQPPIPDLAGRTIMVLPVQLAVPTIGLPQAADPAVPPALLSPAMLQALDGELGYWLQERAPRTRWVEASAVEAAVARTPMLEVNPRGLTIRDFQRARLESIGDPLYGELRRLGALMDARAALLPVGALWVAERTGGGRVHLVLALIDTVGGDVLWYGAIAGTQGERGDAAVVASVAQAVAQAIPQ